MSDKSIAKGILQKYAGDDRKGVGSMLVSAAKMARAEEHASIEATIRDHRRLLRASLEGRTDKVERLKIVQSVRTLDALIDVVYGSTDKGGIIES